MERILQQNSNSIGGDNIYVLPVIENKPNPVESSETEEIKENKNTEPLIQDDSIKEKKK